MDKVFTKETEGTGALDIALLDDVTLRKQRLAVRYFDGLRQNST